MSKHNNDKRKYKKASSMPKYPLFKPIRVEGKQEDLFKIIGTVQNEFDRLWGTHASKIIETPEKANARKAMQEACMWFTRAVAASMAIREHSDVNVDAKVDKESGVSTKTKIIVKKRFTLDSLKDKKKEAAE